MKMNQNLKAIGLGVSLLAADAVLPKLSAAEIDQVKKADAPALQPPPLQLTPGEVKMLRGALYAAGYLYVATSLLAGLARAGLIGRKPADTNR